MYSSLISVMSGINRLRTKIQHISSLDSQHTLDGALVNSHPHGLSAGRSLTEVWKTIEQVFLSLLLWAILGFAAGFLIGMLQPG
jgi:hypothetical protein